MTVRSVWQEAALGTVRPPRALEHEPHPVSVTERIPVDGHADHPHAYQPPSLCNCAVCCADR